MISIFLGAWVTATALGGEGLDRNRMENWLDKQDWTSIRSAMLANEEAVLPFIDEYFEAGLAAIEAGKDSSVTKTSYSQGLAFAKLADGAFGGSVFGSYAASFTGWSTSQQKQFREGQAEYRRGREAMSDPVKALVHLETSLKLCTPLGDTWGQAMCTSKRAAALQALNRHEQAIESATKAIELNESLHLLTAAAGDRVARAGCLAALGKSAECERDLKSAVGVIRRMPDEKRRKDLLERCREVYLKIGKKSEADSLAG